MSDTVANLRGQLTQELAMLDQELKELRTQKSELADTIRDKVGERDEVASALAKLTRKTRAKKDVADVVLGVVDPADAP